MQGFPPTPETRPTLDTWDLPPFNRWSFQNARMVLPTAAIARGDGPASPLPEAPQALDGLHVHGQGTHGHHGKRTTFGQLLEAADTDGCIVLHEGRRVFERYLNGMTEHSLHLSQSVSKSFVSTLVGILWGKGLLDLAQPVQHYVPELAHCGYKDALLWQVLDMRSGVKFNEEDYTNQDAEIGMLDRASGWKPARPGESYNVADLILMLSQDRTHGGQFLYRSIETEVLGWICSRVTGLPLVELMSRELWQPMGAEFEANFTVDRAGMSVASGGLNAALRDYARFGQLMLDSGYHNGRQIVPAEWVAQCRRGDKAAFDEHRSYDPSTLHDAYRRQWWVVDNERGRTAALGIFGQMIWIDPVDQLVVVTLSSWPHHLDYNRRVAIFHACEAIGKALRR